VELGRFLSGNHLFFLNLAMAAARSLIAWARDVDGASIVVGMARNGTTFGVRLPGSDEWYLAPAPPVGHALYHSGQGPETSAPTSATRRSSNWSASAARRRPAPRRWPASSAARWPTPSS